MPSDVDRIAEVLNRHFSSRDEAQGCALRCGFDGDDRAAHLAEQLTAAGFGHVPTALHQAADEADAHAATCPEGCGTPSCAQNNRITANWLRVRADRAGGEA